jgi:hypothetical protein
LISTEFEILSGSISERTLLQISYYIGYIMLVFKISSRFFSVSVETDTLEYSDFIIPMPFKTSIRREKEQNMGSPLSSCSK